MLRQDINTGLPEKDEDGLPVRHSIYVVIVIEERLDGVDESWVHFIDLIKYKD